MSEAEIEALERTVNDLAASNGAFVRALQEIVAPIWFIQQRAKEQGRQVDGGVAVSLANDVHYIRRIAHRALTAAGEPLVPAPPVEAKSEVVG